MANKAMSKTEEQDAFSTSSLQSQLARIRKEEEEEVWISGEELYTEGSSDEEEDVENEERLGEKLNDNHLTRMSANPRVSNETKTKLENSIKSQCKKKDVKKNTSNFFNPLSTELMESELVPPPPTPTGLNSLEQLEDNSDFYPLNEEDSDDSTEISWKAKRGSIVLPNCSNNISDEKEKC